MKNEDFEKLIKSLESKIIACDNLLGEISEDNPIENITVGKLKEIRQFSVEAYRTQTNILMIDTYHVIGMGNLNAVQLGIFTKLIREYSSYRPDLNALVRWNGSIDTLPKIPRRTKFKLLELGLELVSGRGGQIEEEVIDLPETVDDRHIDVDNASKEPVGEYDTENKCIIFNKDEYISLVDFLRTLPMFKTGNRDNFLKAVENRGKYVGLSFKAIDSKKLTATLITKSDTHKDKADKLLKQIYQK